MAAGSTWKVNSLLFILYGDSENMGFGKANNAALKKANGKYILFLNPDTIIAEDTLEMCLAFADGKKDFGGLGIHMIDGSGVF